LHIPAEDTELLLDLRKRMFVYLEKSFHPYWKANRKWRKEMEEKEAEEAERKRMKDEYKANMAEFRALRAHQREARRLARKSKV
jgi:hypothetical protein